MVSLGSQAPVVTYGNLRRLRVRRPCEDIPLGIWLEVDTRPEVRHVEVARAGDMFGTLVWEDGEGDGRTLYLGYRTSYVPGDGDVAYNRVLKTDRRIVLHEPDGGSLGQIHVRVPVGLLYTVVSV